MIPIERMIAAGPFTGVDPEDPPKLFLDRKYGPCEPVRCMLERRILDRNRERPIPLLLIIFYHWYYRIFLSILHLA